VLTRIVDRVEQACQSGQLAEDLAAIAVQDLDRKLVSAAIGLGAFRGD